ncbi:GNAT family N-acetyltransferase [Hoeflea poritis]|uniref:N-acetyltransferase n=1 Tax=Hoeflea poritis TaxID=2993659 RepID=A0ABT4VSV6_9HYPH|nr:N-acetyltransferase [Hoeflea poritis]MDA4847790.1 N-acetyltransferase [Hoeflea poritis]
MTDAIEIRDSMPDDLRAIETLYPDAFPDEDLLPLVKSLLAETQSILSLVAIADGAFAGHVVFTTCGVSGASGKVALLGPLAVASSRQRQGIGSALIREGLRRSADAGMHRVLVLGDPAYYGRFGFAPDEYVAPPYALPDEWRGAWQSVDLPGNTQSPRGKLEVPPPWRHRALWTP